jgi:hypothetical protein
MVAVPYVDFLAEWDDWFGEADGAGNSSGIWLFFSNLARKSSRAIEFAGKPADSANSLELSVSVE